MASSQFEPFSQWSPADLFARDEIEGPVSAEIVRVIDGDTLLVEATPWPQQRMEVYVRIRGHRRTGNPFEARDEARLAEQDGQHALEEMTANSPDMRLTKMSGDKYFGRILANVTLAEGSDPAHNLLSEGFAHE